MFFVFIPWWIKQAVYYTGNKCQRGKADEEEVAMGWNYDRSKARIGNNSA
jgi:hypothetical protein